MPKVLKVLFFPVLLWLPVVLLLELWDFVYIMPYWMQAFYTIYMIGFPALGLLYCIFVDTDFSPGIDEFMDD